MDGSKLLAFVLPLAAAAWVLAGAPRADAPRPHVPERVLPAVAPSAVPAGDLELATDAGGCVAGCGAAQDHAAPLSEAAFERLMRRFAKEPVAAGSPAFEALLFHHQDARSLLARRGPAPLDPGRAEALERELARDHAWIDVRVVDAEGQERVRLGPRRVPLGIKQHVHPAHLSRLQPLEISGTVRRVGLYHLWSRV